MQDVHKANIIAMALNKDETELQTLCARGVLAQWSSDSGELLTITQLDYQRGKSSLAVIDPTKIVAYLSDLRQFRVFNLETKQVVSSFTQ